MQQVDEVLMDSLNSSRPHHCCCGVLYTAFTGPLHLCLTTAAQTVQMGCDLAYVLCTPSAAPIIKGYSPELIVVPELIDTEESRKVRLARLRQAGVGTWLHRQPVIVEQNPAVLLTVVD
jgi:NAD(P)H-hydrate repair Nnr-like enzyme with NAD(P)H-hydrate dehydratase domain